MMGEREPPVQRRTELVWKTVERSSHGAPGALKFAAAGLVLIAIVAALLWAARTGVHGEQLLRELQHTIERQLVNRGITTGVGSRAPGPARGDEPARLDLLHGAIDAGDHEAAVALLMMIPRDDLDRPLGGMTALMRASSAGHANMVRSLLRAGASPNARGARQRTALQYAAEKNRDGVARALLDAGADIDGVDSGSLSPLIMAADRGFTDLALLLIERGANVNIQNVDGWTALMDAAELGDRRLVEALLAAGAEPGARHRSGRTALDFARDGQHQEVVALLSRDDGKPVTRRRAAAPTGASIGAVTPTTGPKPSSAVDDTAPATLPPRKGTRQ